MNAIQPFAFEGQRIRIEIIDGEPWFVLADLCRALDLTSTTRVAERVSGDALSQAQVTDSLGRQQTATVVSEPGMYEVVIRSDSPKAVPFRRWVTHEVIPEIRRTGSYNAPAGLSFEEMTAHVIAELSRRIEEAHERAKALEAPAGAWRDLSQASGDFTVSDAAKTLARAGIETGPRKLYDWLEANRWAFRRGGRWQAMQSAVNAGLIVERITSGYFDQETGERKQAHPQVRITATGLERLRELLSSQALEATP